MKHRGKYAAEVGYRGYGPTYRTVYNISYGECRTDEPFCVRRLNISEATPFSLGGLHHIYRTSQHTQISQYVISYGCAITDHIYDHLPSSPPPPLLLHRQAQWHCTGSEVLQVQAGTWYFCAGRETGPRHLLLTQPVTTAFRRARTAIHERCCWQRQT